MIGILIAIVLFFLPFAVKLLDNFDKWKRDIPVKHTEQWKWVAGAEIGLSAPFFVSAQYHEHMNIWVLILLVIVVFGMMGSWFWFLFDGFYNLCRRWYSIKKKRPFRHYTWWYTGTNDNDDAVTDNFLQRLKLWQHIAVKFGLIILFTALYIFLF